MTGEHCVLWASASTYVLGYLHERTSTVVLFAKLFTVVNYKSMYV